MGALVGKEVGSLVGRGVGFVVGKGVGSGVGWRLGFGVGNWLGENVGDGVTCAMNCASVTLAPRTKVVKWVHSHDTEVGA